MSEELVLARWTETYLDSYPVRLRLLVSGDIQVREEGGWKTTARPFISGPVAAMLILKERGALPADANKASFESFLRTSAALEQEAGG